MGFTESIRSCYGQYATFSGRASRSEFWFFRLFVILVLLVSALPFFVFGELNAHREPNFAANPVQTILSLLGGLILLIVVAGSIIPLIAVAVRRVHDTNASGWFVLIWYVPYIGSLVSLVWACLPGTAGENNYGPDPLGRVDKVFE